jgi:peptidoglycan/xylan/chitin deacetylase (PgdA/CDA1 family)
LPPRAVSVTFDDGYRDNESVALPILRRHGIPATFFVATGFLDGGRMWNDSIIEAVRIADGDALDLRGEGLGDFAAAAGTDRCGAVAGLIAALKYLPPDERAVKVDRIVARVGKPLPDDLMMTSEQVRGLASAGMEIGAHTVGHPILKGLADEAARWEVGHSREELAGIAGRPIELFAYPNGRPGLDYTRRDVDIVRGAGFRAAVSTALGAAAPGADRWQLPRFAPWHRERRPFALRLIRNYGRISAGAA